MKHTWLQQERSSASSSRRALAAVFLVELALGGCSGDQVGGDGLTCNSNSDCEPGWICNTDAHRCGQLCAKDGDCPDNHVCGSQGTCEPAPDTCGGIECTAANGGCQSNGRCAPTPAPAHCVYDVAVDGASCFPESDPETKSGFCNAGACDECLGTAQATESCPLCKGDKARDCVNGHWSAWSPCSNASYPGECEPGDTRSEACTGCSANVFHCGSDCQWDDGTGCTSECVFETTPDQSRSCCSTGTQSRSCESTCTWGSWGTCSVVGTCTPGNIGSQTCCGTGTQTRTCGADCAWGEYSACSQGVCSLGATRIITGTCGNGGQKQQTCGADCAWPADTVFTCINEGTCTPTTTRKVNYGCSGNSQTWNNEICNGSGAWVADSPATGSLSCGAYTCSGTACLSGCTANGQCSGANVCRGGVCTGLGALGDACDVGDGTGDCAQTPTTMICVGSVCKRMNGQTCTGDTDGSKCQAGYCECSASGCASKRCATLACGGCTAVDAAGTACASVPRGEDWFSYCPTGTGDEANCSGVGGCIRSLGYSCSADADCNTNQYCELSTSGSLFKVCANEHCAECEFAQSPSWTCTGVRYGSSCATCADPTNGCSCQLDLSCKNNGGGLCSADSQCSQVPKEQLCLCAASTCNGYSTGTTRCSAGTVANCGPCSYDASPWDDYVCTATVSPYAALFVSSGYVGLCTGGKSCNGTDKLCH